MPEAFVGYQLSYPGGTTRIIAKLIELRKMIKKLDKLKDFLLLLG